MVLPNLYSKDAGGNAKAEPQRVDNAGLSGTNEAFLRCLKG